MNALSNAEVGDYLNTHFVSAFQKAGTFRLANGQKQGGNVASYFCTPEGEVLHVVAGPANAAAMLREARWVVETWKLALLETRQDRAGLTAFFRRAHAERLQQEHGRTVNVVLRAGHGAPASAPAALLEMPAYRNLNRQGQVHLLLASTAQSQIGDLYRVVFERILGEQVSTRPVQTAPVPDTPGGI